MEDMSDLISEFSKMIEKNGVPDNLKDIIANMSSDNSDSSNNFENSKNINNKNANNNNDTSSFDFSNIDIKTFLKLKSALDKMNSKDNPNTKLLLALKPYLKDNKKEKLDQYIKLMSISSLMEVFNNNEGDKKNGSWLSLWISLSWQLF